MNPRIAKAEKIAEAESQQAESRKTKVTFTSAWEDYLEELRTGISAKTKRPYSTRYIADHINLSSRGGEVKGRGPTSAGPLASLLDLPLSGTNTREHCRMAKVQRDKIGLPSLLMPTGCCVHFIKWANYQKNIRE